MPNWYPLQFKPLFRRYVWGGRRLATVLGKPIGAGDDYAESWELVDRRQDQSVVRDGPLAGKTLHQLVEQYGADLFGRRSIPARFPLLLKFLDANTDLSVQVHPDDARAAQLQPPDLGKTEAWLVLHADPGAKVYAGLKAGCTRGDLERAVADGSTVNCMHILEPQVGDCLFIPAGTVHALGGGLVVAEIQQASDTTYRLFDWNRMGTDGKPRPLHIESALEAIDYSTGPVHAQQPQPTDRSHVTRLVNCDKFVLDRWRWSGAESLECLDGFRIVAVIGGNVTLTTRDHAPVTLHLGDVALLPAALGSITTEGHDATMLVIE